MKQVFVVLALHISSSTILLQAASSQLQHRNEERLIGWGGEWHNQHSHTCDVLPRTELAGEVVLWGASNRVDNASNCCSMCAKFQPQGGAKECNVWVWCGDAVQCGSNFQTCWLKHQVLYQGLDPGAMDQSPKVPWTSGTLPRYTEVPTAELMGMKVHSIAINQASAMSPRIRECGSPAVDGYAHVDPACLEQSLTAREHPSTMGAQLAMEVHIEKHADYDGLAVVWGLTHKQPSAELCADACRRHVPAGPSAGVYGRLPCNAFSWCPVEFTFCFEPDAHTHRGGDCWLKFTEVPEAVQVNQRGNMDQVETIRNRIPYRTRHTKAPAQVQWISGVLLPAGDVPSNGTWGPRAQW
eukprot:CAMPEP_0114245086 /NCGR_PEP_ID=MMETSP0058-20121206/11694_1 /TAXON_ID=36894 /ORGANISM="Pyramimonas parkeae, CCMP726" /LENGTH=353 /DNA_ID=CAMNT_0001358087 /DNA_START=180 /DNA_END=1238 /DNA_ORIENTATION=-